MAEGLVYGSRKLRELLSHSRVLWGVAPNGEQSWKALLWPHTCFK